MVEQFYLPDLGENIEAGEIINLLVAVGDTLAEDQAVIELETDKAVIEVPSSVSGKVEAIHVNQGDRVAVGQLILSVAGDGDEAVAEPAAASTPPAPAEAEATARPDTGGGVVEVTLPELGEGLDRGDVVAILIAIGDRVEMLFDGSTW